MSKRNFLPGDFAVKSFEHVETWLENLLNRDIEKIEDLEKWLEDNSELESVIAEDMAWRYIKMTIDTRNEDRLKEYQFFVKEISPKLAPYSDKLNRKLIGSSSMNELKGEAYKIYLRKIVKEIEMFREENIPVKTQIASLSQKYGEVSGQLSIELEGKKMTLPMASAELQSTDRTLREKVWNLISDERLKVKDELDQLFTDLVGLRHQVAENAAYSNFRDYMFDSLGRFDYEVEDCKNFHSSIASKMVPLARKVASKKKGWKCNLRRLKPWDMRVDAKGNAPLKPFHDADDLIDLSIEVFNRDRSIFWFLS